MKKSTFQNKINSIIKKAKSAGKVSYTAPKKKKLPRLKVKLLKCQDLLLKHILRQKRVTRLKKE